MYACCALHRALADGYVPVRDLSAHFQAFNNEQDWKFAQHDLFDRLERTAHLSGDPPHSHTDGRYGVLSLTTRNDRHHEVHLVATYFQRKSSAFTLVDACVRPDAVGVEMHYRPNDAKGRPLSLTFQRSAVLATYAAWVILEAFGCSLELSWKHSNHGVLDVRPAVRKAHQFFKDKIKVDVDCRWSRPAHDAADFNS
jgi:hypothetical protein